MSIDSRCGGGRADFWRRSSLPLKILIVAGGAAAFIGIAALAGLVFMKLWNWLMPSIFGLRAIRYWEGWGLMVLCSMLFKRSPSGKRFSDERRKKRLRDRMREAAEAVGMSGTESGDPGAEA